MGFNKEQYFKINREERFFCFLVCHAILSSEGFRKGFLKLIDRKRDVNLDPNSVEIYPEAAVLRDYWHDLGNPTTYDEKTGKKRRSILVSLLSNYVDLPGSIVDENSFFWTEKKKLWSPGHWDLESINVAGFKKYQAEMLRDIKWAFNCKPDIMLVSNGTIILFEAKVESKIGRSNLGYDQFKIQELVGRLVKNLVPIYENSHFLNMLIKNQADKDDISWQELVKLMDHSDIDDFSKKSFKAALRSL